MNGLKTSAEVAGLIGVSRPALIVMLNRHDRLKPALRLPSGDFLWTPEEAQRVQAHKCSHSKGRPKKQ